MFKKLKGGRSGTPATPLISNKPLPDEGGGEDCCSSSSSTSSRHMSRPSTPIKPGTSYNRPPSTMPSSNERTLRPILKSKPVHVAGDVDRVSPTAATKAKAFEGGKPIRNVISRQVPMKPPAVDLHWQLLPYDARRSKQHMHFDIAFPIDLIRFNSTYPPRYLNAKDLDKPAADVAITKMVIQCPFKTDWEVYVSRTDGIRCRDVFDAIYASFNTVLTPLERQSIPPKDRKSYEEACKLRCKATHGLTAVEEAQGLKRVDVLLHNTVFQGLTQPKSGGDWVLNLGRSA